MTADEEWAQQLLSELPQPRMPEEVRSRLAEAIAQESARSAQALPAAVVPLPAQRTARRRPVLAGLIGAAAALTLFAVIDPLATVGHEQSDSTVAGEADSESGSGSPADTGTVVLLATQTRYHRNDLPAQARRTAAVASSAASASPKALAPAEPGYAEAQECAAAIPDAKGSLVFIDRADFEGEPALIVAFRSGDHLEVVVLHESCTRADPAVAYRVTVEAPAGE